MFQYRREYAAPAHKTVGAVTYSNGRMRIRGYNDRSKGGGCRLKAGPAGTQSPTRILTDSNHALTGAASLRPRSFCMPAAGTVPGALATVSVDCDTTTPVSR
jgi:hypothetical protein